MSHFLFITGIKGFFEIPTPPPAPPVCFAPPPLIKFNKNLRPPPLVILSLALDKVFL